MCNTSNALYALVAYSVLSQPPSPSHTLSLFWHLSKCRWMKWQKSTQDGTLK